MASSASDLDITGEVLCPDILLIVFKHLSTSDILSAARVCKKWKNAVDCKQSWRGRHVCINLARQFDDRFLSTLELRGLEYVSLVATNCAQPNHACMDPRIRDIMQCFTPTLRGLKIQNMRLHDTDINILFGDKMECLEKLEFKYVVEATGSSLLPLSKQCPKLQHLNTNVEISTALIKSLGTNMPKLKTINLIGTRKYDNTAMKDIKTYMANLENLSLTRSPINDHGISQLAVMRGLMSLELGLCLSVTAEAIKILGQAKCPIKILTLISCFSMDSDLVLTYIGQYALGIKKLTICGNQNYKVTDVGFQGLMTTTPSPLENLYIAYHRLTKQAIVDIIKNSPNLLKMNFQDGEVKIPEATQQQS